MPENSRIICPAAMTSLCRSVCLTVAALLALAGCQNPEPEQLRSEVLVFCSEGSPESFNPQLVTSGTSFDASAHNIYDQLVGFAPGSSRIIPGLAESWSVSDDGTRYRFNLRHDVRFHHTRYFSPGRNFNADDVLFSFNRQRLKSHPYHRVSGRPYLYFDSMGLRDLILDIRKLDDHTVEFQLARPESPFLATLAMEFASILSAEYAGQLLAAGKPRKLDRLPIGTGPFKFERYEKDAYIRYAAHPDYWAGQQKLDGLVFAITPDPSTRLARLTSGECDVMNNPLPIHVAAVRHRDDIKVLSQPGLNIAYWAFNTRRPPFDNALVRRALNYAIDRNAIIQAVYDSSAEVAKNPIPPIIWAYNDAVQDYAHDPEKARELLRLAGFPNGFTMDIWAIPVQRAYNPNARKMAEMIQQNLRDIGIRSRIVTYEWGTFLRKLRFGEHDSVLLGWTGDNGDPDNFFSPLLSCASAISGSNRAFWCNPDFDRLVFEARKISDQEERHKLYDQAQLIFKREAPWLTIAHTTQYKLARARVEGLTLSPSGGTKFAGVSLRAPE